MTRRGGYRMGLSNALVYLLWVASILLTSCSQGSPSCTHDGECGWNSHCSAGECQCISGYQWSHNGRDCTDSRCDQSKCLECAVKNKCRRCVDFIEESTGKCLDSCSSSYMLVIEGIHVGKVCPVHREDGMTRIYNAIIIGVGVGILVTAIICLAIYMHSRATKKKKKAKSPPSRQEVDGIEKTQMVGHVNRAFENGEVPNGTISNGRVPNGYTSRQPVDKEAFFQQASQLRPYIDTFLAMMKEAKLRKQALQKGDNRGLVYKNVIHQLCRVLTLLNTDEEYIDIPPDGSALLTWAQIILGKYLAAHEEEHWESASSSPVGTLTSTFKPDHRIVPSGQATGQHHTNNTFKYERYGSEEELELQEYPYVHESGLEEIRLELTDDFTEPIEV